MIAITFGQFLDHIIAYANHIDDLGWREYIIPFRYSLVWFNNKLVNLDHFELDNIKCTEVIKEMHSILQYSMDRDDRNMFEYILTNIRLKYFNLTRQVIEYAYRNERSKYMLIKKFDIMVTSIEQHNVLYSHDDFFLEYFAHYIHRT